MNSGIKGGPTHGLNAGASCEQAGNGQAPPAPCPYFVATAARQPAAQLFTHGSEQCKWRKAFSPKIKQPDPRSQRGFPPNFTEGLFAKCKPNQCIQQNPTSQPRQAFHRVAGHNMALQRGNRLLRQSAGVAAQLLALKTLLLSLADQRELAVALKLAENQVQRPEEFGCKSVPVLLVLERRRVEILGHGK